MSTQSDIAAIRAIMTRLDANRASKFSYTDPAFDNDQIEGVSAFDVNSEQNIPLEGYTNFNETVRGKGVRTQGASLPRMGLNHFFGRTSYNLNKLIQKLSLWMDIDIAARAHNAAEYDPEAPYKTNDVCYSIETLSGVKTVTYYVRSSQTPTTIKGIPVTNGNHWTEVIDKKSGLHHKYAIADLTTGYDTTKWYPVVTPLQAFDATTDGTKDPAIQVSIEVLCNGPVAGFVNNQLAELTVMSKFTGFAASSTDIVLNDSVIDKVTGTDNTSSSLAPIGYTKLPFGRQAVVWLKGGSKYALWNSFGSSFTIYSGAYNNALDQAIAPADAIPFSVTNGSVRADVIGKLNGVAPGAAGLAVLRLQSLSNADPLMSGDPEPGISEIPSREDHVHPHDSSKANLVSPAFTGSPTSESDPDLGALTRQLATAEFVKKSIDFYAGSGSADGNIGYNLTNRQFEVDITGWSTYKDVPAIGNVAAPIDGSGGTPTAVSISRITVNALAGKGSLRLTKSALNGQGEGMSYDFTIDPGNLGLEAQVSLLCRGSSGYADGDVGAYIYDVTNDVLISTSVTSIPKTDTVNGNKFAFLFLPNRTSGSYRLIFNVQTQSTVGWTFDVDNIQVGARNIVQGAAISDGISFVPTITGMAFSSGYECVKARVGNKLKLVFTGNISSRTGVMYFTLPDSLSSTDLTGQRGSYGLATVYDAGLLVTRVGSVILYDARTIAIKDTSGTTLWGADATSPLTWSPNCYISFTCELNISQWAGSGTVGLVQNYEEYASNSDVSATASVTGSGFLQGFGNFGGFGSGWAVGTTWVRRVKFQNPIQQGRDTLVLGVKGSTGSYYERAELGGFIATTLAQGSRKYGYSITMVADDPYSVDVKFQEGGYNTTSNTYGADGSPWSFFNGSYWWVKKTSAGKPGETLPLVRAEYSGLTATAANVPWKYATKVEDTHSAYNPSTGLFTAPVSGVYQLDYTSNHATMDNVWVCKNGTQYSVELTGTAGQLIGHHTTIRINAGDTISLLVASTGTTASSAARMSITLLGR